MFLVQGLPSTGSLAVCTSEGQNLCVCWFHAKRELHRHKLVLHLCHLHPQHDSSDDLPTLKAGVRPWSGIKPVQWNRVQYSMSSIDADEEWEVVDDDGFIYKRRKRNAIPPSPATLVNRKEPVLSEETQLRRRETLTRRKRMAMLLAQKEVYAAEVADWEIILKRQEESLACDPISQFPPSPEQLPPHSTKEATSNEELQILHLQVEAYERFIQQLKSMRDQGESLCKKLEMDVETNRLHLEQDMFKEATEVTPRTILHNFTSPALPLAVANLPAKSLLGQLLTNND